MGIYTHTNIISFAPFWDSAHDNNLTSVVRGCCSCLPVPQRATYWFFLNTRMNSSTVLSCRNVKKKEKKSHPSSALQCKIQMEPGCSLFFFTIWKFSNGVTFIAQTCEHPALKSESRAAANLMTDFASLWKQHIINLIFDRRVQISSMRSVSSASEPASRYKK